LGWMNRRLAVSEDGTIQILLRLPTLLHPSLEELKTLVQKAAEKEISRWAAEIGIEMKSKVNVEAIATKPKPWLVKNVEDQKELESRHGPGLASVAHCLAVYSCKVKKDNLQNYDNR
jgi:predicted NBD/HSP70 family sugar kinase